MARWLLDCRPLCGRPWRLGLADSDAEIAAACRLRSDVFFREAGVPSPGGIDADAFDAWCDHLVVWDDESGMAVAACRAIRGSEAIRRGGLYDGHQFDLGPLDPIAAHVLQGSRTCVAAPFRDSLAVQYLNYGMDVLLREFDARFFLGLESYTPDGPGTAGLVASYLQEFATDPDWQVTPKPGYEVPTGPCVPAARDDVRRLPSVIRLDLRMGFLACGPAARDPAFPTHEVPMLAHRNLLTPFYRAFVERVERGAAR